MIACSRAFDDTLGTLRPSSNHFSHSWDLSLVKRRTLIDRSATIAVIQRGG
jgi:hypothetical protein